MREIDLNHNNQGYTVLELICVLTIVALLAVIIIPTYLHYIDIYKKRYVVNEAQMIYLAAQVEATQAKSLATEECPYQVPGANDLRNILDEYVYEGATYIGITDEDQDGNIDRIDFEKDGIRVTINPGGKVLVDGEVAN